MAALSQPRTSFLFVAMLLLSVYAFSQTGETIFSHSGSGFQYTTFQVPGSGYTVAYGINNHGDIVGSFVSNGVQSGFLYSGGNFQTIACPGSSFTIAQAINDSGVIVGWCTVGAVTQGFIDQNGVFSYVAYPKSKLTVLRGINLQGDMVGVFLRAKNQRSFVYQNGAFTLLGGQYLSLWGINNLGQVAGTLYKGNTSQGVIYSKGTKWRVEERVNYPGALSTVLIAFNDNGDRAGIWVPPSQGPVQGFVYTKSTNAFVGFGVENSTDMSVQGINNSGEVVGFYTVGTTFYGFYGNVTQ